jgi:hypothetical protein
MPPKAAPAPAAAAAPVVAPAVAKAKAGKLDIVIKETDMTPEAQARVLASIEKHYATTQVGKELAALLKIEHDALFPQTTWHCITGSHFGVCVTHATDNLMFVTIEKNLNLLLFKSL